MIEQASYRRPAVLPTAHSYKFASDFSVMMGVDNLTFRRGQVINRDSHTPAMIEKLFDRGVAMLEALSD